MIGRFKGYNIFNQVPAFVKQNNLIVSNQSDYRSEHSSKTSLLSVVENLRPVPSTQRPWPAPSPSWGVISLEDGLLSGSHRHLSHYPLHTPDPAHLITDHRHLSPVIKSTISKHFSRTVTAWSQTFHVDSPDPLAFCLQSRRSCVPILDLHHSCAPILDLHHSCAPPSPSSIAPAGPPVED